MGITLNSSMLSYPGHTSYVVALTVPFNSTLSGFGCICRACLCMLHQRWHPLSALCSQSPGSPTQARRTPVAAPRGESCNLSFTHRSCSQSCRKGHVCKQTSIAGGCSRLYFPALSPFLLIAFLINMTVAKYVVKYDQHLALRCHWHRKGCWLMTELHGDSCSVEKI